MFENLMLEYGKNKVIVALAAILFTALFVNGTTGNYQYENTQDSKTAWELRADQIDIMMQGVIDNPTEGNLGAAYWALRDMGSWSYDNPGVQTQAFEAYLEACNDVRLSLKRGDTGLEDKIDKMNLLYANLN